MIQFSDIITMMHSSISGVAVIRFSKILKKKKKHEKRLKEIYFKEPFP